MPTITAVENYWDSRPCNIKHSNAEVGTLEYFNQVERRKYFVEPHIINFVNFDNWSGKKVLEIGTYMGHSLLIMLLANPKLEITCIDIDPTYTKPSVNVLEKYFNINIKFLEGNSLDVLKLLNDNFDFFHIDGTHQIEFVKKEFDFCTKLATSNTINVVFDDYNTVSEMGKLLNEKYQIVEYDIPNCEWNNAYYKIKI